MSFSELGISPWLIKTLDDCGLKNPTPVQSECIVPTLEGTNIIWKFGKVAFSDN